ncbi:hypothetical protein ACGFQG_20445 [Nocardia fluminea]|uniref:hypothetical protein n=1 Tax=Nocardia fluminea TaxID=134984 RepID=UPI00371F2C00
MAIENPVTADPTYLVAHDLWYRACADDRQIDATRNAASARLRRSDPIQGASPYGPATSG